MPVHLDAPSSGAIFDPARFSIRGWLWLEHRHSDIAAVEAYDGQTSVPLGELSASELQIRPDVNAAYQLAAETRTGFTFPAHHPRAAAGQSFEIHLRVRFRTGERTSVLFARQLTAPPLERHPYQMLLSRVGPTALGLEIGAHTNPAAGLSPFYTDAVVDFAGSAGRVDFLSDARALPLPDNTLDYLVSSHVLEHLPDPLAALHEWRRVLRPGGLLYLVVPDKRFTFDAPRPLTTPEHLLRDFREGTTAADAAAHVDEFVFQTDWARLSPTTAVADRPARQAAARDGYLRDLELGRPIDIHYHTFTPDSLIAALRAADLLGTEHAGFTVVAEAERYPPGREDGIALLLVKSAAGQPTPATPKTFQLAPTQPGLPSLPLVCPVSLEPLARASDGSLASVPSSHRYSLSANRPTLLPNPVDAPRRPWNSSPRSAARPSSSLAPPAPAFVSTILAHLDEPVAGAVVDPTRLFLRGWLFLGHAHATFAAVEAWSGQTRLGETTTLHDRPDVTAAHQLAPDLRTGFELSVSSPVVSSGQSFPLELRARLRESARSVVVWTTHLTAA